MTIIPYTIVYYKWGKIRWVYWYTFWQKKMHKYLCTSLVYLVWTQKMFRNLSLNEQKWICFFHYCQNKQRWCIATQCCWKCQSSLPKRPCKIQHTFGCQSVEKIYQRLFGSCYTTGNHALRKDSYPIIGLSNNFCLCWFFQKTPGQREWYWSQKLPLGESGLTSTY